MDSIPRGRAEIEDYFKEAGGEIHPPGHTGFDRTPEMQAAFSDCAEKVSESSLSPCNRLHLSRVIGPLLPRLSLSSSPHLIGGSQVAPNARICRVQPYCSLELINRLIQHPFHPICKREIIMGVRIIWVRSYC